MTVMVTGGCGFIGSHVIDMLISKGYNVEVIGLKCDLQNLQGDASKVKFHRTDIQDRKAVMSAIGKDTEAILHLAALINVDESIDTPEPFWNVNVLGTFNMLEAARQRNIPKLVFMGTCEVYGNIPKGRADENHPTNPLSPYAASKFAAERYLLSYATTYGDQPNIAMIRGFNQYGPRQNSGARGAVIAKFMNWMLDGKKLQINGDGAQTRDYVYVKDTVRAVVAAMEKKVPSGEIFNAASERDISIREIAEKICEITGRDFDKSVQFNLGRPGELMRSIGSSDKARKMLGWSPSVSIDEGLRMTYDWYKQNRGKYATR
ncbi:MAG: GDP-mannose 4,6-dehydratase [Candidatus Aenigmarchaeota archaeon]|nr:GDP-mannose 4,6-dehydratase [Candidatus Aenigmarchaeota archaeon]